MVSDLIRGNQLLRSGKLEEAVAAYQSAIAHNPSFHWSHYKLGEALEKLGRWEEAATAYWRLVELCPRGEYYQQLGELLVKQEKWDEAITVYRQAIEINPESYLYYHQLGEVIYNRVIQNPESFFVDYNIAELPHKDYQLFDPELPELCFLNDEDFLQATSHLDDQSYVPEIYRVYLSHEVSDDEKRYAIQWLSDGNARKQGIELCRELPEFKARLNRSIISVCMEEAIKCYRHAINMNPSYPDSYYNLAEALINQSRYDQAITYYEKAVTMKPESAVNLTQNFYYHMGQAFANNGKYSQAITCYEKLVNIQPDKSEFHFQLATILQQQDQIDGAIQSYQKAVAIEPDWPEAVARIGRLQRQQEKFKRNPSIEPIPDSELALSVVIPTYNRANRLRAALEDYLKTDRSDIEFLISDNDSTDHTAEIVQSFMDKDKRIKYIKNPSNLGANRNIFRGILSAKAPIIMFLTDDDSVTEGFIDLVLWTFEAHPTVGIVHQVGLDPRGGKIYGKGTQEGLYMVLNRGMIITGMAFRRNSVDFDSWQLECSVFPQMWLAADLVMRYDMYGLNTQTEQCIQNKYVFIDCSGQLEESVRRYFLLGAVRTKSMPWDWGIPELVNIGLHFIHQLPLSTKELWNYYRVYFAHHPVGWFVFDVFPTWYAQDWEGTCVFLGRVLTHPYIRFSLIFWNTFILSLWSSSQVKIADKILLTLLGCFMIIWRIMIHLQEFTDPGLANIYYVGSGLRKDTLELKHSSINSELESSFKRGYSSLTVVRDLGYELQE